MHLESQFDPNVVGDQGTSLGVFQIGRGGLAPRDWTNEDLNNAETNTQIVISNMTSAYNRGLQKSLKGTYLLIVQVGLERRVFNGQRNRQTITRV